MKNVLLCGIPGAGKTTVGNFLAKAYGYHHIDMEADSSMPDCAFVVDEYYRHHDAFMRSCHTAATPTVISWGFRPFRDIEAVRALIKDGFQLMWLDGNRAAAFESYMMRENFSSKAERSYYRQLARIMDLEIIPALSPSVINVFMTDGTRRPLGDIAEDIIELVNTPNQTNDAALKL